MYQDSDNETSSGKSDISRSTSSERNEYSYNTSSDSGGESSEIFNSLLTKLRRNPSDYESIFVRYQHLLTKEDNYGQTLLHYLILIFSDDNLYRMAEYLISIDGFDINATTSTADDCYDEKSEFDTTTSRSPDLLFNATTLHYCIYYCKTEILQLLLDNDANPNAKCDFGLTPIHYAFVVKDVNTIQFLLNNHQKYSINIIVEVDNPKWRRSSDLYSDDSSSEYSASECLNRLQDFPRHDGILHPECFANGMTVLHLAATLGDASILKSLLEVEQLAECLNQLDLENNTALSISVNNRNEPIFKLLLRTNGIITNFTNVKKGQHTSLLQRAITMSEIMMAEDLYRFSFKQQGDANKLIDQNIIKSTDLTFQGVHIRFHALVHCINTKNSKMFKFFIDEGKKLSGSPRNPLTKIDSEQDGIMHIIAKESWLEGLQIIEASTISDSEKIKVYNEENKDGLTPIRYLIRNNAHEMIALIANKIKPALKTSQLKLKQYLSEHPEFYSEMYGDDSEYIPQEYMQEAILNGDMGEILKYNMLEDSYLNSSESSSSDSNSEQRRVDYSKFDGMGILHDAVKSSPDTLLAVLNVPTISLSMRDSQRNNRPITVALNNVKRERSIYTSLIEFKSRIQDAFRGRKETWISPDPTSLRTHVKNILSRCSLNDLIFLYWSCGHTINTQYLIELIFDFSPEINKKHKHQKLPITKDFFLVTVGQLLKNKPYSRWGNVILTPSCQNYLILEAAQKAFSYEIPSDGEEIDSNDELLANQAKQKILSSLIPGAHDSEITQPSHLSQRYIPIFRGINFNRNLFTKEDRLSYLKKLDRKSFFPSFATFTMLGEEPHEGLSNDRDLLEQGDIIRDMFMQLSRDDGSTIFKGAEVLMRECKSFRHLIQKIYTEDYTGFTENIFDRIFSVRDKLKLEKRFPNYRKIIRRRILRAYPDFEIIFEKNCCVSGSLTPDHAVRYALGVSRAQSSRDLILNPRYDKMGKPKYPRVGVVFIALIEKQNYKSAVKNKILFNLLREYALCHLNQLSSPATLLNEVEITFAGYMDNILIGLPIEFPDCSSENEQAVCDKFNIHRRNRKEIFDSLRTEGRKSNCHGLEKLREKMIIYYTNQFKSYAEYLAAKHNGKLIFPLPDGRYSEEWLTPSQYKKLTFTTRNINKAANPKKRPPAALTRERKSSATSSSSFFKSVFQTASKKSKKMSSAITPQIPRDLSLLAKHGKFICSSNNIPSIPNFLVANHFTKTDVPGDGNCYFNAIATSLRQESGITITGKEVRAKSIQYLEDHPELHIGFGPETECGTLSHYLGYMSQNEKWAYGPIIDATVLCYNIRLTIIDYREDCGIHPIYLNEEQRERPLLTLLRTGQNIKCQHYTPLRRQQTHDMDYNITPSKPSISRI